MLAYKYQKGDCMRSARLCWIRFGWIMLILGATGLIVTLINYTMDNGPQSLFCENIEFPFYSQFRCKGQFDGKDQYFLCGDSSFFTSTLPNENAIGQSCGNIIPACIQCDVFEKGVISHGFQCHAQIQGCDPLLTTVVSNIFAFGENANISNCKVNDENYQQCTPKLKNEKQKYFPVFITLSCISLVLGIILILSCRDCCCGQINNEEECCGCICIFNKSCLWYCCFAYCSDWKSFFHLIKLCFRPMIVCIQSYCNFFCEKTPKKPAPGGI